MSEDKIPYEKATGKKSEEPDAAYWLDYQRRVQEATPQRLEDAAKFLAGMISISLTIFLRMKATGLADAPENMLTASIILWFVALGLAFLVIFPMRYKYFSASSASIRQMHEHTVKWKYAALFFQSWLLCWHFC